MKPRKIKVTSTYDRADGRTDDGRSFDNSGVSGPHCTGDDIAFTTTSSKPFHSASTESVDLPVFSANRLSRSTNKAYEIPDWCDIRGAPNQFHSLAYGTASDMCRDGTSVPGHRQVPGTRCLPQEYSLSMTSTVDNVRRLESQNGQLFEKVERLTKEVAELERKLGGSKQIEEMLMQKAARYAKTLEDREQKMKQILAEKRQLSASLCKAKAQVAELTIKKKSTKESTERPAETKHRSIALTPEKFEDYLKRSTSFREVMKRCLSETQAQSTDSKSVHAVPTSSAVQRTHGSQRKGSAAVSVPCDAAETSGHTSRKTHDSHHPSKRSRHTDATKDTDRKTHVKHEHGHSSSHKAEGKHSKKRHEKVSSRSDHVDKSLNVKHGKAGVESQKAIGRDTHDKKPETDRKCSADN